MIIDNKIFERADRIAAINPFKISFSFWGGIKLRESTLSSPRSVRPARRAVGRTAPRGSVLLFLQKCCSLGGWCYFTMRTKRTALPLTPSFDPGIPPIVKL